MRTRSESRQDPTTTHVYRTALHALLLTAGVAALVLPAQSAQAGTLSGHQDESAAHCLLRVESVRDSSKLVPTQTVCSDDFDVILRHVGAPEEMIERVSKPSELTETDMRVLGSPDDRGPSRSTLEQADAPHQQALSTFVIGVHFDASNLNGDSFSVSGSSCAGGHLNVAPSWNNRISSTKNGCSTIGHFDGYNKVGTSQTTTGAGGALTYMDNRTSSIQYS